MALNNIPGTIEIQPKPAFRLPGSRTDSGGKAVFNVLLLALPDDEYDLIRPYLEFVDLPQYFVMHEPGQMIEFGYFPNSGMASLVVTTKDRKSIEVGIVGKEGMVGTPLGAGMNRGPYRAIMQISGAGVRISAAALALVLPVAPNLRQHIHSYVMLQGLQMAQVAACNRLHELEQRLSRWLLMCQDRVDSENINLTHEFLAQMMGSGRPSVTLVTGMLEQRGAIETSRGMIKIIDRKCLEEASCECYDVIQNFNGGLGLR